MLSPTTLLSLLVVLVVVPSVATAKAQCPTFSGRLNQIEHGVTGRISVSSDCKVKLRDFSYDGLAPQVYLWWGEDCTARSLARGGRFSNKEVPERRVNRGSFSADVIPGLDFKRIGCLSVYCEAFNADLGDVKTKFKV